ncbi:MAG TPA: hypothetical protein VFU47_02705 [Armatimonadota bacterium]|nr:hypothetical protein [Armatimonadota bacterium]
MSAEYAEVQADPEDREGQILELLAGGMPYVFVAVTSLDPLNLRAASAHSTDTVGAILVQTLKALPGQKDGISDGYHTFGELYDHRRALTAALAQVLPSWRSKAHHPDDSPMFEGGYFIVGIDLPGVGTITYHYKLSHWDDFAGVDELAHAPKWDGAAPADTVTRLLNWAGQVAGERERIGKG